MFYLSGFLKEFLLLSTQFLVLLVQLAVFLPQRLVEFGVFEGRAQSFADGVEQVNFPRVEAVQLAAGHNKGADDPAA
ncbi:hypothetical protein ES708_34961 [subsurface metagenome]